MFVADRPTSLSSDTRLQRRQQPHQLLLQLLAFGFGLLALGARQHGIGQPRRHSLQAIEHLPRRAGGTGGGALAAFDVLQGGRGG